MNVCRMVAFDASTPASSSRSRNEPRAAGPSAMTSPSSNPSPARSSATERRNPVSPCCTTKRIGPVVTSSRPPSRWLLTTSRRGGVGAPHARAELEDVVAPRSRRRRTPSPLDARSAGCPGRDLGDLGRNLAAVAREHPHVIRATVERPFRERHAEGHWRARRVTLDRDREACRRQAAAGGCRGCAMGAAGAIATRAHAARVASHGVSEE
jgi:hypothetical protein